MPRVWVSVGSNIERERNVAGALEALRDRFGELVVSPLYETPAVGFDGNAFYNLVVGFDTELRPAELHAVLKDIEYRHGRKRGEKRFAARTLDLDLLTWGDAVTDEGGKPLPRDEILKYAFVLAPLADVAGDERHPETGQRYVELWARFAGAGRDAMVRLDTPAWAAAADSG
jgi:2-amino-4-hydroxy-6-hydroxymethyldihydropteridine diphosphokinase